MHIYFIAFCVFSQRLKNHYTKLYDFRITGAPVSQSNKFLRFHLNLKCCAEYVINIVYILWATRIVVGKCI